MRRRKRTRTHAPHHGRRRSFLSDHGSTFYAVESVAREKGLTEFEKHPPGKRSSSSHGGCIIKTNGEMEKFFEHLREESKFSSVEAFVERYDCDRPHGAFDLSKLETPVQTFYRKMEVRESIFNPEWLTMSKTIS